MEELISAESLTLASLIRANWPCNEPPLAWDRDNPFRERFTENQFVNASSPRLDQLLSVRQEPTFDQLPWLSLASDPVGYILSTSGSRTPQISIVHRGEGALLGRSLSLNQDGADENGGEGFPAGENQGLREGLLQEERPADSFSYRCDDGLLAGISPQVAQPVYAGKGEFMDESST